MDKEHKDPETVDLKAPRLAQYMQNTWKKHQNTVYWVDIKLAQNKGIKVLSDAIECHHPLQYTPSPVYPEGYQGGNWRNQIRKSFLSHLDRLRRFPLRDNWMKELGSEVARQAEVNQPTQPNPNPDHDGTGRPVETEQRSRSMCSGNRHTFLIGLREFQCVCWTFR